MDVEHCSFILMAACTVLLQHKLPPDYRILQRRAYEDKLACIQKAVQVNLLL